MSSSVELTAAIMVASLWAGGSVIILWAAMRTRALEKISSQTAAVVCVFIALNLARAVAEVIQPDDAAAVETAIPPVFVFGLFCTRCLISTQNRLRFMWTACAVAWAENGVRLAGEIRLHPSGAAVFFAAAAFLTGFLFLKSPEKIKYTHVQDAESLQESDPSVVNMYDMVAVHDRHVEDGEEGAEENKDA